MSAPDDDAAVEPLQSFDPVSTARRRHGGVGAIMAAGMFGLDQALGRKPKEEAPIVMAASDEPVDIDQRGDHSACRRQRLGRCTTATEI